MSAYLASPEIGERIARFAISKMRRAANRGRLDGGLAASFETGSVMGQLLVAEYDCATDPLVMQAIKNEAWYLAWKYGVAS